MARIIGIDLGTTNTAVAVLDNGRPRVIEDERGYKVLPSVVSSKGEGRFVVGQAAASLILTRPDRTVYATKRLIGRRFDSTEVQRVRERIHYQIREAADGGVEVQVGESWMTPQEVAAVVLQVARGIAERSVGEPVEEAVVTVPAHFNHQQRQATLEAAKLAGLRCDRLLNEPTAAALGYGHRKNVDRKLVIFDLGGGTFDVSVLHLHDGIYEILATNGDTFLGGEDFDYRVVDHLADDFMVRHRVDLREDKNTLQRLKDAGERAKCELSFSDRANVVVPHVAPGKNLEALITRQRLEDITADLVERCLDVAREAVAEASLQISDVDEVILVGGQTRMPRVREAVAGLFGREPSRTVHPEEAVAIGAAVHAHSLEDVDGPRPVLLDVTPFDLGIDAAGGMFAPVINRQSRIPCTETKVFATVHDDQESVRVTVRQGESKKASENEFLGEFVFDGLPPAPRLQTKVAVTFRIDHNGMLHVSATDPATGAKRNIGIRNYAEHAREPHPPSAGEAKADAAKRASDAQAVAPAKASTGTKEKVSLLAGLFGSGGKKPKKEAAKPAPAEAAPPPTPEPVAAEPEATPAIHLEMPPPPPLSAEVPGIDLSAIAPPPSGFDEPGEAYAGEEPGDAVPPMEEDDLYGNAGGAATFGLAGGASAGGGAVGEDPFSDEPTSSRLSTGDLFGDAGPPAEPRPARGRGVYELDESQEDAFAFPDDDGEDPATGATVGRAAPLDEGDQDAFAMPEDWEEPAPPARPAEPARKEMMTEDLFGFAMMAAEEEAPTPAPSRSPVAGAAPPRRAARLDEGDEDAFAMPDADSEQELTRPLQRAPRALSEPDDAPLAMPSEWGDDVTRLDPVPVRADEGATRPLGPSAAAERKARKPAKVKLHYKQWDTFAREYRDNLRRNGAFIRTDKPLSVGRECVFEVGAPGLGEPLVFPAVVASVSDGRGGTDAGMRVEYRLDEAMRRRIERVLSSGGPG
ncbi:MAG: Hsp70 family protein [Myxococcota bacterium]